MAAEEGNNNNLGLAPIQPAVFENTPKREAAFQKLPGAPPTKLADSAREKVEQFLVRSFYPTWKVSNGGSGTVKDCLAFLKSTLQGANALISGGFLLRALGVYEYPTYSNVYGGPSDWSTDTVIISDIDIYVQVKEKDKIIPLVKAFHPVYVSNVKASLYCNSFLKRNKIRSVHKFDRRKVSMAKYYTAVQSGNKAVIASEKRKLDQRIPGLVQSMDIMLVRNKRNPVDVVQNFDLTFCQVWYDGSNVYATHPEHIIERVGYLQGDYVKVFLAKNRFLKNRLEKYRDRGFEIRFDPAMLADVSNPMKVGSFQLMCKVEISPRTPDHTKHWAMSKLLDFLCFGAERTVKQMFRSYLESYDDILDYTVSPDNELSFFDKRSGYDSEDYDFENKEPLFEIAEKNVELLYPEIKPLTKEEIFYQMTCRFISEIYKYRVGPTPTLLYEYEAQKFMRLPTIKPYMNALRAGVARIDMDSITLDDVQVFDFHAHKLDKGISKDSLDNYILENKAIVEKDELPCYLAAEGCTKPLTRADIRPFASLAAYKIYVTTQPPKEILPLGKSKVEGLLVDTNYGLILRNRPKADAVHGGLINKETMCPFCLRQEARYTGCAYMIHEHGGGQDVKRMPYCSPQEQVKSLWKKYRQYQAAIPGYPKGLEWCAICGGPTHGHDHFDSQNPGQLKPYAPPPPGASVYGYCPGGGRKELIARMLAVRAVEFAHRGDAAPDHKKIREEAAFAADAAPRDPALMARAAAIFAQEAATRKFNNVGVNEYSMAPPAAAAAAEVAANIAAAEAAAEEEGAEAAAEAAAANEAAEAEEEEEEALIEQAEAAAMAAAIAANEAAAEEEGEEEENNNAAQAWLENQDPNPQFGGKKTRKRKSALKKRTRTRKN